MLDGEKNVHDSLLGQRSADAVTCAPCGPAPPNFVPMKAWEKALDMALAAVPGVLLVNRVPHGRNFRWEELPRGCDPSAGGLQGARAERKRHQVNNMMAAVDWVRTKRVRCPCFAPTRVVEFCASSGFVALPLAAVGAPGILEVVAGDMRGKSISILQERADLDPLRDPVRAIHGRTEDFNEAFDVGVALHACGEASDAVLDACMEARAAFVLSPCCVGRVGVHARDEANGGADEGGRKTSGKGPAQMRRRAAASRDQGDGRVRPRSDALRRALGDGTLAAGRFSDLARAAGYSTTDVDPDTCRRRHAKTVVDADRLFFAAEAGYCTRRFVMTPSDCTPLNDVLIGWPAEWEEQGGDADGDEWIHIDEAVRLASAL